MPSRSAVTGQGGPHGLGSAPRLGRVFTHSSGAFCSDFVHRGEPEEPQWLSFFLILMLPFMLLTVIEKAVETLTMVARQLLIQ